jgi:uncharacterized protein YcbX
VNPDGEEIGRVIGLWRYPVKSMAGEPLSHARIGWHGVLGDRRWAFLRADVPQSGFPWLTIREQPDLVHYRPLIRDPARPDRSDTWVRTPGGAELDITNPALAAELAHGARAIKQDRGVFDALPLSLLTTQSVTAIADVVGRELDIRRFRPNILLDAPGSDKFPEDAWIGTTLAIGTTRVRVDARDQRCVVGNVDPDTSDHDPSILRAIAREHQAFLGVYGTTVRSGQLRVGDRVLIAS